MTVKADTRREPLTRHRILHCALAVIDRDGLEALSMRKLAAELDVSPMSLYNHIPNKEALLEGVTEVLLLEIDLSFADDKDWTHALKIGYSSFRDVLVAHPKALPLMQGKAPLTPDAFRPVEAGLRTLRRAGLDIETASHVQWTLVGFTIGHAAFQVHNLAGDEAHVEAMLERKRALPPEQFPNLLESLVYSVDCDFAAAFEFGLDAIIEGLRAKVRRAQTGV